MPLEHTVHIKYRWRGQKTWCELGKNNRVLLMEMLIQCHTSHREED